VTALTSSYPGTFALDDMELQVLSPSPGRVLSENRDNRWSAVIRLVVAGESVVLFGGDIDRTALDRLLDSRRSLSAMVLVFPHHGGHPGEADARLFARDLTSAVKPDIVLFSMGRGRFDNPLPSILRGVRQAAPDAYVLCTQLSKGCASQPFKGRMQHSPSAGEASGFSCHGTFRLPIPPPPATGGRTHLYERLDVGRHRNFVESLQLAGESPQCQNWLRVMKPT
jgi:hypothetical protein